MNVPRATYEVIYNGTNITGNILPYLKSLTYSTHAYSHTIHTHGHKHHNKSDELQIVLEDSEHLWQTDWYPVKGDSISAKIFYLGNVLDCGKFTIDEITGDGGSDGDTFTIKALAAGINKGIRTKHSYAHENKTLREIVNTIAAQNGLTVLGNIDNVRIDRETQHKETDLAFLQRLADDYGYTFSIRDTQLVFTDIFQVENKQDALTIDRSEISTYSITDKTAHTFKAAKLLYHNPRQKKVISHQADETNQTYLQAKNDTLFLHGRVENEQQAEIKTKVALYRANSLQQSGTIEMDGNVYLLAGNNITISGLGFFSGKYYVESSEHTVDTDGGYGTSAEIKRISK